MRIKRSFTWPKCGLILFAVGLFFILVWNAESPSEMLERVLTLLSQMVVVSAVSIFAFYVVLRLRPYFSPSISTIEEFKNKLMTLGIAQEGDFRGCTEDEIQLLMDNQRVQRLPALYYELLRSMGKSAGHFEHDISFFFYDLFGKKEVALASAKNLGWDLPDDAFVFSVYDNRVFLYFRTIEGDDPPVYIFCNEDNSKPGKSVQHLSQQLFRYTQEYSQYFRSESSEV